MTSPFKYTKKENTREGQESLNFNKHYVGTKTEHRKQATNQKEIKLLKQGCLGTAFQ